MTLYNVSCFPSVTLVLKDLEIELENLVSLMAYGESIFLHDTCNAKQLGEEIAELGRFMTQSALYFVVRWLSLSFLIERASEIYILPTNNFILRTNLNSA